MHWAEVTPAGLFTAVEVGTRYYKSGLGPSESGKQIPKSPSNGLAVSEGILWKNDLIIKEELNREREGGKRKDQ